MGVRVLDLLESQQHAAALQQVYDGLVGLEHLLTVVFGQSVAQDAALAATATRLADILNPAPTLGILTVAILSSLHTTMNELADRGFAALRPRINQLWGGTPRVKVDLDHGQREGVFTGVDDLGRLLLREDSGQATALATHEVKLLREL